MSEFWEQLKFKAKLFVGTIAAMLVANPLMWLVLPACVALLALFLIFGSMFASCGENRNKRRLDNSNAQIENANLGLAVDNQTAQNANAAAVNANRKTKQAETNLNAARNVNANGIAGKDLDDFGRNWK